MSTIDDTLARVRSSLDRAAIFTDFDGTLSIEPLLSYQLNPFSVFYIGANVLEQDFDHKSFDSIDRTGDGFEPTSWQYFFKFQYFFRM